MKLIAGIDGGGTKTRVICQDLQGRSIAEETFGAFNVNSIGEAGFRVLLEQISEFLCSRGECAALCIGAAGVSNPQMKKLVEETLQQAGIENWHLVGDHEIALWGALEGKPGVSLVAGTGSICCARNEQGESIRVGGWGHLIGDEGSGYAIGKAVLTAVSHLWDGYGEPTCLAELLEKQLQLTDRQAMISYVYKQDKSYVARVSRLAEQAAAAGDAVAIGILKDNAGQLALQVEAAIRGLHLESGEVALLGGLLENETRYRGLVIEEIEKRCAGFHCVAPKQNAAVGAVMMAREFAKKEQRKADQG